MTKKIFSLIDKQESFVPSYENFVDSLPDNVGTNYLIFTISGPQSSGKSTLLNTLFGTSFKTLNLMEEGFHRTTEGINYTVLNDPVNYKMPVMILDVEGTDSTDRAGDSHVFENKIAMFSLCISHIFLMNMWFRDLGRYSASGASLLRRILEINLSTFETKKRIWLIFVVRDFNKEIVSVDKVKELIINTLKMCWESATEGKKFDTEIELDKMFEIDFLILPDYYKEQSQFNDEVEQFNINFQNRVIRSTNVSNNRWLGGNVPSSECYNYWTKLWDKIRLHKDLNLPNERKLITIVKCKTIKESIIKDLIKHVGRIKESIEHSSEFNTEEIQANTSKVKKLIQNSFDTFQEETKFYDKTVTEEYFHILTNEIKAELIFFDKYILGNFESLVNNSVTEYDKKELFYFLKGVLKQKGGVLPPDDHIEVETEDDLNQTVIAKEEPGFYEHFVNDLFEFVYNRKETFKQQTEINIEYEGEYMNVVSFEDQIETIFQSILNSYLDSLKKELYDYIFKTIGDKSSYYFLETKLKSLLNKCPIDISKQIIDLQKEMYADIEHKIDKTLFLISNYAHPKIKPSGQKLSNHERIEIFLHTVKQTLVHNIRIFIKTSFVSRLTQLFDMEYLFNEERLPIHYSDITASRAAFKKAHTLTMSRFTAYKTIPITDPVNIEGNETKQNKLCDIDFIGPEKYEEMKERTMQYMSAKAVDVEHNIESRNKVSYKIHPLLIILLIVLGWNELMFLLKNPLLVFLVVVVAVIFYGVRQVNKFRKYFEASYWEQIIKKMSN